MSTGGSGSGAEAPSPQQVAIHVREDSGSSMDALFDFIKNKDQTQLQQQTSYRHRKLPLSFFKPPSPRHGVSHSREGSQEGGFLQGQGVAPQGGVAHVHIRSQSEPAQLHNFSAPPPPPQHVKQQSVDYTNELGVLPPGWDIKNAAASGRFLTVNADQSWQDPRKSLSSTALNQQQPQQPQQQPQQQRTGTPGINSSIALANQGLPHGWEQGVTLEGEIYFINHITKTTSWYDPRLPKEMQRLGVKVAPGQPQRQLLSPPQQGTPPQQLSPSQHPPPSAQQTSPQQQVGSPQQQQQQQQRHNNNVASDQYLHLELQKIELEKERLRHEQEEIVRREQLLKDLMLPVPNGTPSSDAMKHSPGGAAAAMQSVTSGMDPFLGQASASHNLNESHVRQSSADSGLGGMGTSYSLPRTPEDFLTNVDEMDSSDAGHKLPQQHNSNMQGIQTMDIGDTVDNTSMMDSEEDLVPSLQQDIGTELLNDIEIQKMDNLLWL